MTTATIGAAGSRPEAAAPGAEGRGLKRALTHPVFHAAILVAIVTSGWTVASNWDRWTGTSRFQRTDDAFIAGDTTPLATQISGYVRSVAVDDYQVVASGQLIAEIDPADYQAQRDLAEADLAAARASLAGIADKRAVQAALIDQAKATIDVARAELAPAAAEAKRQRDLLQTGIVGTEQHVEQADADAAKAAGTLSLSQSQLVQQQALLTALDAEEQEDVAQVAAAEARLKLAQDNLGYTRILAPANGMTGARQVRPGQFVSPGTQLITLMPLAKVWVIANLKETQMTNVRVGDRANITVDAFPDVVLSGRVENWSPGTGSVFALLPPDNATGNFTKVVQRMPVKIALDQNPALGALIRPGMSVIATIDTGGSPGGSAASADSGGGR
ncbi:HlyD family secretion protein [Inquilinus sp. OTU3971]|uniref:HlyD family secretion protein n=1 Tax=Inquilinus sp. OTU3971 TaxID=3043855 RepID=UPI00313EE40E